MPFEVVEFDRVVLVRWQGVPTMFDVHRMSNVLSRAHRETGRPILYVALVPAAQDGVPPPDVRAARVAALRDALSGVCESLDVIMLSGGLAGLMQRTVVRGMTVLAGMSGRVFIHDSAAHAIARLRNRIQDQGALRRLQVELNASPTVTAQPVHHVP